MLPKKHPPKKLKNSKNDLSLRATTRRFNATRTPISIIPKMEWVVLTLFLSMQSKPHFIHKIDFFSPREQHWSACNGKDGICVYTNFDYPEGEVRGTHVSVKCNHGRKRKPHFLTKSIYLSENSTEVLATANDGFDYDWNRRCICCCFFVFCFVLRKR